MQGGRASGRALLPQGANNPALKGTTCSGLSLGSSGAHLPFLAPACRPLGPRGPFPEQVIAPVEQEGEAWCGRLQVQPPGLARAQGGCGLHFPPSAGTVALPQAKREHLRIASPDTKLQNYNF